MKLSLVVKPKVDGSRLFSPPNSVGDIRATENGGRANLSNHPFHAVRMEFRAQLTTVWNRAFRRFRAGA